MKLRGIFWKPGTNGLGVFGFHHLPYRHRFDFAAREHDSHYDLRGNWTTRRWADITFMRDMLKRCDTDVQVTMAVIYYIIVRLFGWAFFRYKR